jgi:alkylated DNA nucleotide flippase Atl1
MEMDKRTWTTYQTVGYTYDVANDQRSAGGVHHHQVRKTKAGWQHRIEQSNGRFSSYGPVSAISVEEGENRFAIAKRGGV